MSKQKNVMVVLSGGMDSTTCLFWAKKYFEQVHAVTFDYGQRHSHEIDAACRVATVAGVASHEIVKIGNVLRGRSPLTNSGDSTGTNDSFPSMGKSGDDYPHTFVPMRNALFLTLAANIAVSKDCFMLATGISKRDNLIYPDCRSSFLDAQERAINEALGLDDDFGIIAPLLYTDKVSVIYLAYDTAGAWEALAHTHTCESDQSSPCGVCHPCIRRSIGFAEAGYADPLIERSAK